MPPQETGKSRAQRIQLDYYRQSSALSAFRRTSIWVSASVATLFGVYALIPMGAPLLSTGPLASAHASFENDCWKCHIETATTAIAADAWRWDRQASLDPLEQACQDCHPVPSHFRDLLVDPSLDQDCSRCHREHQGRAHDLTRVADTSCQNCHAALNLAIVGSQPSRIKADIVAFTSTSHGDFASLREDAGEIRFDHAQHLQPGQVRAGNRGGMRLDWLEPAWQAIYRQEGQADDALVELTCHDCHQPGPGSAILHAGASDVMLGQSHQPIQFDEHCAGCHELNYLGRNGEQLPLPHAAPWSEIQALMTAKIHTDQSTGRVAPPYESAARERMPGDSGSDERPTNIATDEATIAWAVGNVRDRCELCHRSRHLKDGFIAAARADRGTALIPPRWLQRGMFDHSAHVRMDCGYCHPMGRATENAKDDELVMIRGIDSCTGCHRSETTPTPAELTTQEASTLLKDQPTWASDHCVLCHRYHWTRPVE